MHPPLSSPDADKALEGRRQPLVRAHDRDPLDEHGRIQHNSRSGISSSIEHAHHPRPPSSSSANSFFIDRACGPLHRVQEALRQRALVCSPDIDLGGRAYISFILNLDLINAIQYNINTMYNAQYNINLIIAIQYIFCAIRYTLDTICIQYNTIYMQYL